MHAIRPKPELFGNFLGGIALLNCHLGVTSAEVAIICPGLYFVYDFFL